MITAFDIYLVMQLDSISCILSAITLFLIIAIVFFSMACIDDLGEGRMPKYIKHAIVYLLIIMAINSLIPSSKTAAAMIIIPKIASDKNIDYFSGEAKELYKYFKQSLLEDMKDDKTE